MKMFWVLLAVFAFVQPVSAALSSGTYWEVRTTGDNDNGGCYDAVTNGGTDYSQQDTAQLSATDLATSGAVTTLTSATGGFTSAMVSNCIDIASGTNFDAGIYQITAYTDTNTVTLDRTPSAGGAGSSGVGKVGGGDADFTDSNANVDDDNKVYVKAGTYTQTIKPVNTVASGAVVVQYIGYNSTRDDNPTDSANMPLIDGNSTLSFGIDLNNTLSNYDFSHFYIKDTTNHCVYGSYRSSISYSLLENCGGTGTWRTGTAHNVEFSAPVGVSMAGITLGGVIFGNYFHDGTDGSLNAGTSLVAYNIFDSSGGNGITRQNGAAPLQIIGNTIYNVTQIGIDFDAATAEGFIIIANNIITNSGNQGIYIAADGLGQAHRYSLVNNVSYDNDGADLDISAASLIFNYNNDTATDPGFTDAANGDFSIGTALKGAGVPGVFPGGLSTGYMDPGAVQRQEPTGGGASAFTFVGN